MQCWLDQKFKELRIKAGAKAMVKNAASYALMGHLIENGLTDYVLGGTKLARDGWMLTKAEQEKSDKAKGGDKKRKGAPTSSEGGGKKVSCCLYA